MFSKEIRPEINAVKPKCKSNFLKRKMGKIKIKTRNKSFRSVAKFKVFGIKYQQIKIAFMKKLRADSENASYHLVHWLSQNINIKVHRSVISSCSITGGKRGLSHSERNICLESPRRGC